MAFLGSSCIFPTEDIKNTAEYYVKPGFSAVEFLQYDEPHICLYYDNAEIILTQSRGGKIMLNRTLYGYGYDAYIYTNDRVGFQEKCRKIGVKIVKPLTLTDYNNSEFVIEDTDGRWVAFGLKTSL